MTHVTLEFMDGKIEEHDVPLDDVRTDNPYVLQLFKITDEPLIADATGQVPEPRKTAICFPMANIRTIKFDD